VLAAVVGAAAVEAEAEAGWSVLAVCAMNCCSSSSLRWSELYAAGDFDARVDDEFVGASHDEVAADATDAADECDSLQSSNDVACGADEAVGFFLVAAVS
jgi:hypothetical protein